MIPDDVHMFNYNKIRIPKGVRIGTTHPKGARINPRTYVVQLHTTSRKWDKQVTWRGSGGYWFWADKADCDLVK